MDCSLSEGASEYLDALYEAYDGFDVQQTTVAVNPNEFEAVDSNPEGMMARVEIEGPRGVLAVPDGDEWALPGGVVDGEPSREQVAALVAQQTGVETTIDSLRRVSLVCLQCEVVDGEVWTLSAVFTATPEGGTPIDGATWRDRVERRIAVPGP
jgi:ADP-ribose pyrophosphatase YjhB (NUDIX family)